MGAIETALTDLEESSNNEYENLTKPIIISEHARLNSVLSEAERVRHDSRERVSDLFSFAGESDGGEANDWIERDLGQSLSTHPRNARLGHERGGGGIGGAGI